VKKIIAVIICLIFSISFFSLSACNPKPDIILDKTKSQLYVGIYNGGWGRDWLDEAARIFEERYKDAEFEPGTGKKGVQVIVTGDKKYSQSGGLKNTIAYEKNDMYFSPIRYYDFVSLNLLLDIDDIVNKPLNEIVKDCDETATIKSKMFTEFSDYYSSYQNKFYAIPLGGSIYSINYDVDLFDDEKLYIGADTPVIDSSSTVSDIVWVGGDGNKSLGQDGLIGTYDDGLPVTWHEFKLLMQHMYYDKNIIPFLWSSEEGYTSNFLYSLAFHHEGKDVFDLNITYDGIYTFGTTPTQITKENGYLLQGIEGKKRALEFAKEIISKGYYHEDSGKASMDFMSAQDEYLMSKYKAENGQGQRVAFLIDGGHWHNEARETIGLMEEEYGNEYKNRKFGIMPFPRFEGHKAEKTTFYTSSFTNAVFINKLAEQKELAKTFLAFTTTDEILKLCTKISGMIRLYDYTMEEEDLNAMPYYYQNIWETFNDIDIVHYLSTNPMIYENQGYFEGQWRWTCQGSGVTSGMSFNNPFIDFGINKNLTVDQYFSALKNYYDKTKWDRNFNRYY